MSNREHILHLEERLTLAEKTGDAAALAELVHADFVGVTIRGYRVDKAGFIDSVCNPYVRFLSLQIEDLDFRLDGTMAVVFGRSRFELEVDERLHSGTAQYFDLWREVGGRWALHGSSVTPETR